MLIRVHYTLEPRPSVVGWWASTRGRVLHVLERVPGVLAVDDLNANTRGVGLTVDEFFADLSVLSRASLPPAFQILDDGNVLTLQRVGEPVRLDPGQPRPTARETFGEASISETISRVAGAPPRALGDAVGGFFAGLGPLGSVLVVGALALIAARAAGVSLAGGAR